MDAALLWVLRIAGPAVLVVCAWAVWERRLTFGSRYDSAATIGLAFFGVGAALDAPWRQLAAASYPIAGKFYGLTLIADLCYISGGAAGVSAIYRRLLPDDVYRRFIWRRVVPAIAAVGTVMVVCFAASTATAELGADHAYLIPPDGWLTAYWVAHFGTTTLLGLVCGYGVYQLRRDPRGVLLNLILAALLTAALFGGLVVGWGVITGRIETLRLVAWLLTYAAFAAAAVGSAGQWRHRVGELTRRSAGDA